MAKKNYIPKQQAATPVEEPWTVVGGPSHPQPGRPIYLQSRLGITRERAEELASRVEGAVAVPVS